MISATSRILAATLLAGIAAAAPPPLPPPPATPPTIREFRSIDGTGNNARNPARGSAGSLQKRIVPAAYADGHDAPSGADRPSARAVSNAVCAQTGSIPNRMGASDLLWQWGQFLDHDIVLTATADPAEPFPIAVPSGDPYFDPAATGTKTISLSRSYHEAVGGVRQQANELTSYIDASQVYGSDAATAAALRRNDGSGMLKTSAGNMLPLAADGFFFEAGDIRVNEQIGLIAIQTLFMREHNYWADQIRRRSQAGGGGLAPIAGLPLVAAPVTDEKIYQTARAIVGAEMQAISYREFLPALLGPNAIAPYRGYDPNADATIANEFAVAAYRFGHSMLSPTMLRLDAAGNPIAQGNISLADSFFAPDKVRATGIDPILRGLARQKAQELDAQLVYGVRNFLFGPPGAGGFDLASLNIQRGRDHGLPAYNALRRHAGLPPARTFADITRNAAAARRLASVYATPDLVDPWVGMLAEDDVQGALVGPTLKHVLARQFEALRNGDRFWYENHLAPETRRFVEQQTLATVVRRNTAIRNEIPNDAFHVPTR